jgi:uncharacterized protein
MTGLADATEGPREVFARMKHGWLAADLDSAGSLLADDAVIEEPFAPPGRPRRFEGGRVAGGQPA